MKGKNLRGALVAIVVAAITFGGAGLVLGGPPWPSLAPTGTPPPPSPPAASPGADTAPPGVEINQPPVGPGGVPIEQIPFPYVRIRGKVIAMPDGARLGTVFAEAGPLTPPNAPTQWNYITRGKSIVTFTSSNVLEWSVAPEDEADFRPLKAAFEQ
ncbi:MAG: hypothetical protein Q7T33_15440 [Dehalococcoidia bacterium]|nr:hypothetical protein [Dehalococcoidia bacterium]